jgi:LmeA-like phospholipid-binding
VRKLVIAAVVLMGAGFVADEMARSWAEAKLAERAAANYQATSSSSLIRSFPFLGRLALQGVVPEVELRMEDVRLDPLLVRSLDLDLRTVEVDRAELTRGRLRLVDIGEGRIDLRIDGPSLAQALGADLQFRDGSIEVRRRVGAVEVMARGELILDGNTLRLQPTSGEGAGPPAFALTYQVPRALLPPCRTELRAVAGALVAGCTFTEVPESLLRSGSLGGRRPD